MNSQIDQLDSKRSKYFLREEVSFIELFVLWGTVKMNELALITIKFNWSYFTMIEEKAKTIRENRALIAHSVGEENADRIIDDALNGLVDSIIDNTIEKMDQYFFNYEDSLIEDLSIIESDEMMKFIWDKKGRNNFAWVDFVQMFVKVNFQEKITGKPPVF